MTLINTEVVFGPHGKGIRWGQGRDKDQTISSGYSSIFSETWLHSVGLPHPPTPSPPSFCLGFSCPQLAVSLVVPQTMMELGGERSCPKPWLFMAARTVDRGADPLWISVRVRPWVMASGQEDSREGSCLVFSNMGGSIWVWNEKSGLGVRKPVQLEFFH